MNDREVMQQALGALYGFMSYLPMRDRGQCDRYDAAITALRTALEQQAEPVMLNGLTEAETNATASVLGLTKQAEPVVFEVAYAHDGKLFLNGRQIGPGTIDVKADGLTYRSSEKVEVRQQAERWCMKANGCKTECGNCPNFTQPQQQAEPCQFCGLVQCDPRCMWIQKDIGVEQAEPIGWLDGNDKLAEFMHRDLKAEHDKRGSATPRDFTVPVYTAPPQQQAEPVQEPICYASINKQGDVCSTLKQRDSWRTVPLYTAPPQRKPLTIVEVEQILAQHSYEIHGDRARYIVRMTEEAHGIKEGT